MDTSKNNKVQFDPGWNDPPTFNYNPQLTTPNKPKLNKRVAFPLSNQPGTITPAPVSSTPPLLPLPKLPSRQTVPITTKNPEEDIQVDSEKTLQDVKEILVETLNNSTELGSKIESIKKKINLMEEMWCSGKLNSHVQMKMYELVQVLRENPRKADDIHKALMVDHVSAVGIWMPGIKQLIYHCIAKQELLSIDKE